MSTNRSRPKASADGSKVSTSVDDDRADAADGGDGVDGGAEVESSGTAGAHGYNENRGAHLKRLRRIEGQARGLQRMVEDDKYCIDILTQVSAMTKALQAVALSLLEEHMAHCVLQAAREGGAEGEAKLQEASDAIARLVRS